MSKVNFKAKEIGGLVLFTPRDEDAKGWWTNNVPVGFYFNTTLKCGDAFGKSFVVPIKHAHKIWSDICTANNNRGWSVA
tara:strand:+ start:793 stop:1029 length:237 start_codon:yes stop_codon:yes gene_type:complete